MKMILVAEDDPLLLKTLGQVLKKEGYKTLLCENGKKAVEQMANGMPDLLITDLFMPEMDGIQLVTHIRQDLQSHIPILVLSASGEEARVLDAFRLGANDYVTKPFNPRELSLRVRRLLN
ncbi:response regulator [Thermoflavifilum thermophilum]|uniref:Response regulator receiver domain-containing protein n=1 Tax=Thermoflavifilum thermophilum TaxID=1393122 RepID=A0A1I7NCA9_9BACT|nr:response regulator transcription factor [Thermoflavifilum thermophilum]SFV32325.1 Response regulator receiver domain-containing protein [Thermoflavifilum thermophilum]